MSMSDKSERRLVHYNQSVGLSTLFRPLPKAAVRPSLDVTYQPSSGGTVLRFSAKEALGIPEQTLLLVLMELAKEQFDFFSDEVVVNSGTKCEIGRELWSRLQKNCGNANAKSLRLETCWHELNRRCGSQSGGAIQVMRMLQLKRLCEVIVWEHDGDEKRTKRQSYLVVWLVGDDERIHLALNCRLASALLGQPYAQVSMTERLELKRDIPMALHAFFSTTLSHGHSIRIGLERLIERLWPGSGVAACASTHRSHRSDIRDGLDAIGRLDGWSVTWERNDLASVRRFRAGVADMTSHKFNKTRTYRSQALPLITNEIAGLPTFDVSGLFLTTSRAPE